MDTEPPPVEPDPPSRVQERPNRDEGGDIDASLFKNHWQDPDKHPKDLEGGVKETWKKNQRLPAELKNWSKITDQEYSPDVRFLATSKKRSKSYTSLDVLGRKEGLRSKSAVTITEVYTQAGPLRVRESEWEANKSVLVTKKGVVVPHQNYWLDKPGKATLKQGQESLLYHFINLLLSNSQLQLRKFQSPSTFILNQLAYDKCHFHFLRRTNLTNLLLFPAHKRVLQPPGLPACGNYRVWSGLGRQPARLHPPSCPPHLLRHSRVRPGGSCHPARGNRAGLRRR